MLILCSLLACCVHLYINIFQKKSTTVSYSHHSLFNLSHAYITVIPKTPDCMGCAKVKKEKLKFAWNVVKVLVSLASLYLFCSLLPSTLCVVPPAEWYV